MAKVPADKYCHKCNDTKLAAEFYRNSSKKDGLSEHCKPCWRAYLKHRNETKPIRMKRKKMLASSKDFENQPEKVKAIVFALVENPNASAEEVGKKVGLGAESIRKHMSQNTYLRALRGFGSEKVTRMLPKALHALEKSLEAKSEDVALKAAKEVLQNEKVLGPDRIDVTVNDLSSKTNAELEAIIASIPSAPSQTIEAEIIS